MRLASILMFFAFVYFVVLCSVRGCWRGGVQAERRKAEEEGKMLEQLKQQENNMRRFEQRKQVTRELTLHTLHEALRTKNVLCSQRETQVSHYSRRMLRATWILRELTRNLHDSCLENVALNAT